MTMESTKEFLDFSSDQSIIVFINLRYERKIMPKSKKPLEFYLDGIHHIDCLEGMKQLPDESIDLVITSPPYADMRAYEGGFEGFHPDNYVAWFLPYVAEISRILKPTGSFILNINDKSSDGFRHPFVFELIFAIHNAEDYCKLKDIKRVELNGLRLFERLFWNKGKFLAQSNRFGDKVEYVFWFSKTDKRIFNMDLMRLEYDEKSIKRMQRPLKKRFRRELDDETTEYKQGGEGSWAPKPMGAAPGTLIEEGAMKHVKLVTENLPEGTVLRLERNDAEGDIEWYDIVQPEIGKKAHPSTEIRIGSESRKIADNHVAVYPERLVNYFIQGATNEGHVVLDPFMGTGTTAVVAFALNRHYIGFDISENYVQFAKNRIKNGPYLEELKDKVNANKNQRIWDELPKQD